jgi:hypothetical protein
MNSPGHSPKPHSIGAESAHSGLSPYDHAPRFMAFAEHQEEVAARLETLLANSKPQPVDMQDPEGRLLLSTDEISRLWGLFPAGARERTVTNPPVIKTDGPRWFIADSSSAGPVATDKAEEALSPTAHGMAVTNHNYDDNDVLVGTDVTVHEIPENGFSDAVKRLVQAGVIVHELAHTIEASDIFGTPSGHQLLSSTGQTVAARNWAGAFAEAAEQYTSISRYAAAYRDANNAFPREGGAMVIGVAVAEEIVDSITAELLGFIVAPQGLTFEPFKGREELQRAIRAYMEAQLVTDK